MRSFDVKKAVAAPKRMPMILRVGTLVTAMETENDLLEPVAA